MLRKHPTQCLETAGFEKISESTLLKVVETDDLIISEVVLFQAVKRWAENECRRRKIESNSANMRSVSYSFSNWNVLLIPFVF